MGKLKSVRPETSASVSVTNGFPLWYSSETDAFFSSGTVRRSAVNSEAETDDGKTAVRNRPDAAPVIGEK